MELVRRLLATQPNITALNLEFSEIDSLDTLLPLLARFPRLQQLDLSGNRLTSLPASLAPLKEIQYLNLANNLFEDCQSLIPALQTLPQLVELALTVNGERDEQLLLSALPKLQVLNDLQVAQGSLQEPGKSRLQQEDLEQVAQLYDEVRSSWKLEDAEKDAELGDDFDQHVKEVMSALYEGVQRSPALEHALMVQAKYDLYEICFQKAVDLVHLRDAAVGGILLKVKQAHAQMVAALVEVVASSLPSMQEQLQQASADTQKAQRETAEVLEAAEQLESEHLTLKEDAVRLRAAWEAEKAELTSELEELRQENQRCLEALIKHSKATAASALAKEPEFQRPASAVPRTFAATPAGGRALSLKQLKDAIEEIYASKVKFDQKCKEGQLPRETMEQHMYSFLNKKYGLKVSARQSLMLEWAAGIVSAVKRYSSEDNDVMVFGQILKNQCDEEFRLVQQQVKETISELLKMFLRGKFPLKTNSDIEAMLAEKCAGYVGEDEWTDIVKYMYNPTDAELLISLLQELQQKRAVTSLPTKKKPTREELLQMREKQSAQRNRVSYKDFLKVLLDFQLHGHEKFLQSFLERFRGLDEDGNGVVNEGEFRALVDSLEMGREEAEVTRLLGLVDPFNNQQITFSDCVALLSTEGAGSQEEAKMSILQQLSLQQD